MPFIRLQSASVEMPIYGTKRMLKRELIRLATGGILKKAANKIITVKALHNISLFIKNGDRVGIIGHNGAGKTTLLRLIAGIYEPTKGQISTQGNITALLNVMFGINEESTGYENIVLSGLLQGLTRQTIESKKKEIIHFTGLGDYLHMPVRTYSNGMKLRLAFGIATSNEPEIFLIDEIVGIGDTEFMIKARERLAHMIERSSIVLLSSHDISILKQICNRILWLDTGSIRFYGDIEEGMKQYSAHYKEKNKKEIPSDLALI